MKRPKEQTTVRYHLTWPEREQQLLRELERDFPRSSHQTLAPRIVESRLTERESEMEPVLAFACQTLPEPIDVTAPSVSTLVDLVFSSIVDEIGQSTVGWQFHAFAVDREPDKAVSRRCVLIREGLEKLLKKKHRDLMRRLLRADQVGELKNLYYVQLVLVTAEEGVLSVSTPETNQHLRHIMSPHPGGWVGVPDDKRPPGRAYRKLVEAQHQSGLMIAEGELCVDLGAAPGSWTAIAVQQGAKVIAVDRAPLDPSLVHNEQITAFAGDGFTFEPGKEAGKKGAPAIPVPVDWMLCDIIAYPERSIGLLERWLRGGWCKNFCITFKFKGQENYAELDEVKRLLPKYSQHFILRQLYQNKNEVTVVGRILEKNR